MAAVFDGLVRAEQPSSPSRRQIARSQCRARSHSATFGSILALGDGRT